MKKFAVFAAVAALAVQVAAPASAAVFNDYTMQGWQRTSGPAAMGYVRLPFNGSASHQLPRAGLMLSGPGSISAGHVYVRSAVPGAVDFGFTGRSFTSPWTATLNLSNTIAWASNPAALPKNTPHLLEGPTTWIIVGAVSAALIVGFYVGSESK